MIKTVLVAALAALVLPAAHAQELTQEQKDFILANADKVSAEIKAAKDDEMRQKRQSPAIKTEGADLTFVVQEGKRIGLKIGKETVYFNDVNEIAKKDYTDASLSAIQLGYSLALPAIARIPALEVRQDLIRAETALFAEINSSKVDLATSLAAQDAAIDKTVKSLNADVEAGLAKSKKDVSDLAAQLTEKLKQDTKALDAKVDKTSKDVDAKIAALKKATDDASKVVDTKLAAVRVGPYEMTDDHIKLLTGYFPREVTKYWNKEVLTAANNGNIMRENRGRKYYRVKFNIRKPGYFSPSAMEFVAACKAMSYYLEAQDNVRRDLMPVCDHHGNSRDSKCVTLHDTYFSHCGCHGCCSTYSWERGCGGLREDKIRHTVFFAEMSWNGNRHLAHQNGACRHTWLDPAEGHSSYQHTLCTSSNDNYQK